MLLLVLIRFYNDNALYGLGDKNCPTLTAIPFWDASGIGPNSCPLNIKQRRTGLGMNSLLRLGILNTHVKTILSLSERPLRSKCDRRLNFCLNFRDETLSLFTV